MADEKAWPWPPGIGPNAPRLNSVSYAPIDPVPPGTSIPRPSDVDLDLLFLDETRQQQIMGGLRSWEMAALHLPADGSPDEGRIWNTKPFLEPDESKWFSVFTHSHWLNVNEKVLSKYPELREAGYNDEDTWSVDDQRIWAELSKVIELANALLNVAAEGEWLQNNLLLSKTAKVVGKDKIGCFLTNVPRLSSGQRLTADAVRKWIEDKDFHKRVHWALSALPAKCVGARALGVMTTLFGHSSIFIKMDVGPLVYMLGLITSPSQAAAARVNMAVTMIHELAHAMNAWERMKLPSPEPFSSDFYFREPFYGDETAAECGHSFIHWTFGADWAFNLQDARDSPWRSNIGTYWASLAAPWPIHVSWRTGSVRYPCKMPECDILSYPIYPIPNGWMRAIQHKDFWAGDVKKYGPKALEFPRVLRSDYVAHRRPFLYSFCRPAQFDHAATQFQPQYMRSHFRRLISSIEARRDQWRQMRPWQHDGRLRWSATPWSNVMQRDALQELVDVHFALPRTPIKEHRAATNLAGMGQQTLDALSVHLTKYDEGSKEAEVLLHSMHKDTYMRSVKSWFYVGISNLVKGCLPERKAEYFPPVQLAPARVYTPSAAWESDPGRPYKWNDNFSNTIVQAPRAGLESEPFYLKARHLSQLTPLVCRSVALASGLATINRFHSCAWCPTVTLKAAVDAAYADLMAQLRILHTSPFTNMWLHFEFVLPPYVEAIDKQGQPYSIATYTKWPADLLLKLGPPSTSLADEDPVEMWTGLPNTYDGFGTAPSKAMRVVSQAEPDYLTISELYDLRRRRKCAEFVLVRSGLDLEAYDQDILRQALGCSQAELQQIVERSPYGWCLNEETAGRFRARQAEKKTSFDRAVPMAKVVQWVRPEEVAVMDGKNGRRTWIMVGDQVYDVSELSLYPADDKLEKALLSNPGGNPMMMVCLGGYEPGEVVKKLREYRVAMIIPPGFSVAQSRLRLFTSEELAWHEFRETGMYLRIYDDVYDVSTAYLDMHPGGVDILSAYAGRDATKAFEKYHAENGKELLEGIQALKIGRMIKTYQPDAELAAGEVRIRDRVFLGDEASAAVKDLKGNPTEEFEAALKRMADGGADEPIVTLWNKRQDLVVGRVANPPEALSTITKRQMRVFNGEAQDSCFEHAAYMAVDDLVYDISTLLQFGHPTILGVLRQYAGRICTDKKVGEIMKTRYDFRAVARLSAHEAKDGVDWDPRRLRHDIGDADLKRLAAKYVPWESKEQNRKRKYNEETKEEEEEEEFTIPPQTVSKMPMPAPADGERPAKRRDGGVGDGSKWLDWKTEGLVEELQEKFASGQIFAEWQAREMERFETEAKDMEGYWEKVAEERVGA